MRLAESPGSLADSARNHMREHRLFRSGFERAVPAVELEEREFVVIEGRVLASDCDTDDGSRVRLTIVQALGPPPGDQPDPHETVLICPADMILLTARHYVSNADMPHGDGMHLPKASLIYEDALAARDVVSGQVVMLDGQLVSTDGEPADRGLLRLTFRSGVRPPHGSLPDRREIVLVCPRETIMVTVTRMAGWPVDKSVAADELEDDQAVILKGRVVGCTSDPTGPSPIVSAVAFAQSGSSERQGPSDRIGLCAGRRRTTAQATIRSCQLTVRDNCNATISIVSSLAWSGIPSGT